MKADRFQINLDQLPKYLQQELLDYYNYLLQKYQSKNKKNTQRKDFFNSIRKNKFSLPDNYRFNRDLANER